MAAAASLSAVASSTLPHSLTVSVMRATRPSNQSVAMASADEREHRPDGPAAVHQDGDGHDEDGARHAEPVRGRPQPPHLGEGGRAGRAGGHRAGGGSGQDTGRSCRPSLAPESVADLSSPRSSPPSPPTCSRGAGSPSAGGAWPTALDADGLGPRAPTRRRRAVPPSRSRSSSPRATRPRACRRCCARSAGRRTATRPAAPSSRSSSWTTARPTARARSLRARPRRGRPRRTPRCGSSASARRVGRRRRRAERPAAQEARARGRHRRGPPRPPRADRRRHGPAADWLATLARHAAPEGDGRWRRPDRLRAVRRGTPARSTGSSATRRSRRPRSPQPASAGGGRGRRRAATCRTRGACSSALGGFAAGAASLSGDDDLFVQHVARRGAADVRYVPDAARPERGARRRWRAFWRQRRRHASAGRALRARRARRAGRAARLGARAVARRAAAARPRGAADGLGPRRAPPARAAGRARPGHRRLRGDGRRAARAAAAGPRRRRSTRASRPSRGLLPAPTPLVRPTSARTTRRGPAP